MSSHPTGDRGQRYEIRYSEDEGEPEKVFGWANDPDAFEAAIELHPCWCNRKVIDRQPEPIKP